MPYITVIARRDLRINIEAKVVWSGNLDALPRVGEDICVYEDWASEVVERVTHSLEMNTVTIQIRPDATNAYPVWIEPMES